MERLDLIIKTIIGFFIGVFSFLTGLFGVAFVALLLLMLADFITGLITALYNEGLKSARGYKGLFKKIYTMLLIGAVYLVEIAVLDSSGAVADGLSGAFCVIELVSIVENGNEMGVKLPRFLAKIIATMKNQVNENDDDTRSGKQS
ncbi:holin [Paenibacillaceae bacterium]|nr:holin [Paenibacillaceae bacterium]